MNYSIKDIARVIHAKTTSLQDAVIDQLLLDSRKLHDPSSSLFFALQGPRRDGHQFIAELYKNGVRNFVVSAGISTSNYPDANFLEVSDTRKALQDLAAFHRQQFSIPVIGITGSNGKTIVKEWLYQLLHESKTIVRSPKSYNSQIGVPLSIWQMNKGHELAIIEAGISTSGEMDHLEQIIRPTIGVLTTIGDAHNEGFRNQEEKLLEKIKLFKRSEWIVCHSKYDPQQQLGQHKQAAIVYCGEKPGDQVQVLSVKKEINNTVINLRVQLNAGQKEETIAFRIPFTDDASIENALLCFAVLQLLFPYPVQAMPGLMDRFARLEPVEMRMELVKGINNCYIINDSYSNDISSLGIALDYLRQQAGHSPATVILSDILQSGIRGSGLYQQVAHELKQRNIQRLIGIGEQMSAHYPILKEAVPQAAFYLSTDHFLAEATSHQFREDYILLKGARSFTFERISKWLEQKVHQTLLEINLNALAHNLRQYQSLLSPRTKVMAMVKAFGYGSGGAEIAGILQYHKVDYLGVAYADEGVDLRKAGIHLPVMVMNPEENSFDAIVENNLEPEIYSFKLLRAFTAFLEKEGIQHYPVHIEIETGMNRLGFPAEMMEELGKILSTSSSVKIQSVFSHLAASEEKEQDQFTRLQAQRFAEAVKQLRQKISYPFFCHIANSAAIVRHPSLQLDMVRLGIGLYGVDSSEEGQLDLQTVATLKTTVAQIRQLQAGESVSYNRSGKVDKPSLVATVRLGYADGYPRRLGNGIGKMIVNGEPAPVIGTVCMDMTMLDITAIPGVKEGDDVIVFGADLPVEQLALWAGTIPYEIMTGISQRVKRVYFEE